MRKPRSAIFNAQQSGLVMIVLALAIILTFLSGHHLDRLSGSQVNDFLNPSTLLQIGTDTSFFAVMAVGMTMVIVSGGIDLSIGSIFALCEVMTAMFLRLMPNGPPAQQVITAVLLSIGIALLCGLVNGIMVARLGVHPFIITLGTMWVFRGIAFVASHAESILVPTSLTDTVKATLGLRQDLFPVPALVTVAVAIVGQLYLSRTTHGRRIFAVGGNIEAARYAGVRISHVLTGVYVISGLTAGIAAFLGNGFYGSASCNDANGYELYVIAGAVVGGASLSGGRGSAIGAVLGALLIVLIRQAIRTLHLDQNFEWIIIGVAIVVAVVLDRVNQTLQQKRLALAES